MILKGGFSTTDPRLDRLPEFDERSRNFPVRAAIPTDQPRSYTWGCALWLDQGREGACVGFSVSHEAGARPSPVRGLTNEDARAVYRRAQQLDEWPGEEPAYSGSSVLAGVKAGMERGWYSSYRWAFGLADLALAVGRAGPAVLGINWYEGMFDADSNGFIHVDGEVAGGHAILCNGVSVRHRYFSLHNSWGAKWGRNGSCRISWDDMDRLLHENGDAAIPMRAKL